MKKLIVIAGATASGKTQLAIQLANKLNCPILSADSRQVYKELNIGVARPSDEELAQAKHFFIASHSIHKPLNAGMYEKEAIDLLQTLFLKHDHVILCGGTGLYIKAITQGLDTLPNASPELRKKLQEGYEKEGISFLQTELLRTDPHYYPQAEIHNPQRLIRAIEIAKNSGKSNLELRQQKAAKRNFSTLSYAINLPREELYERINQRVEKMLADGLEEEAKSLFPFKHLELLKTVGYKEFFDYFENKTDLQTCIELIKQNTRNYAKRQLTWFRNQGNFRFVKPDPSLILSDLA